jgi:phage regulator Rha-like protein
MNLVKIENNEPITSTLIIAEGMNIKHRAIMELVDKYEEDLKEFGIFTVETENKRKETRGLSTRLAWVNEGQTYFLISLMRNSKIVITFKKELIKEFERQKDLIARLLTQRTNASWIEQREQGKLNRREETDVIQEFINYCIGQGSEHPDNYWTNISTMENKALFMLEQKFKNVRDALNGQQLQIIASADLVVARALKYGMEQKMEYHAIFQMAKERILEFADLVGKTPVPLAGKMIDSQNTNLVTEKSS